MYLNLANAKFDEYGLMSDHVAKRSPPGAWAPSFPAFPAFMALLVIDWSLILSSFP